MITFLYSSAHGDVNRKKEIEYLRKELSLPLESPFREHFGYLVNTYQYEEIYDLVYLSARNGDVLAKWYLSLAYGIFWVVEREKENKEKSNQYKILTMKSLTELMNLGHKASIEQMISIFRDQSEGGKFVQRDDVLVECLRNTLNEGNKKKRGIEAKECYLNSTEIKKTYESNLNHLEYNNNKNRKIELPEPLKVIPNPSK